ncbi:hypothetical protein KEH51_02690 [[Brevibacterium] frigoritolerans]|uniref:Uncharacterized protein n=1 Tax=Peribacillus frigoritolerans TaxID=450367 RepID=A0A941FM44_9BACI|nr:hypothetical protein [Peribacillus frigoritolerans]
MNGQEHDVKLCSTCYKEERNKLGAAMGGMDMGNSNLTDLQIHSIHLIIMVYQNRIQLNKARTEDCLRSMAAI